ncbi:MAG TPA: hypothetical protein VNO31_04740, partial [Umezawaea sp.]|nr:hypothetical protein [Umezawaea sp.]
MAGAVAFVFGLCALSFAAGCVVTAVMLRHPDPAEDAPVPTAPPQPEPVPPLRLSLPSAEVAAKPIHRNPVVGLPAPVALEHGDAAPAALALAPDPTFTGVFDPPPARLPVVVEEPAAEPLEVAEPKAERSFAALPNNGRANWVQVDPWTGRSLYEEQELLLEAACTPVARPEAEPNTLRVMIAETEPVAEPVAEVVPMPGEEPSGPVHEAIPTARNGQRSEVERELVARPELSVRPESVAEPEPAIAPEADVVEAGLGAAPEAVVPRAVPVGVAPEPVVVPEVDTMFASRSGLVTDLVHASLSEQGVSEQGVLS